MQHRSLHTCLVHEIPDLLLSLFHSVLRHAEGWGRWGWMGDLHWSHVLIMLQWLLAARHSATC